MCIAPTANVKKRRTCPERLVWRCGCTSWEVQLAARSGPFSFASQPSGWFTDSSVLWGCSYALYYTPPPPTYKSSVFVKFGICYKYSPFFSVVWRGGGPLRHCCAMPPPLVGAALAKRSGFTRCQAMMPERLDKSTATHRPPLALPSGELSSDSETERVRPSKSDETRNAARAFQPRAAFPVFPFCFMLP